MQIVVEKLMTTSVSPLACFPTEDVRSSHLSFQVGNLPIPPLLLIREEEESLEAKLDGFSTIREFDKLSFLVKLDIVRNLDWTEGT